MIVKYADGILREKKNLKNLISDWSEGNDRVLNIVTIPYNSCDILIEEIMDYVYDSKRVLYIVNSQKGFSQIVEYLKKVNYLKYSCIADRKDVIWQGSNLVISTYERALDNLGEFNLVVYDDITSFSPHNKFEILELLSEYYRNNSKIICRSVEAIFQNANCIDMPAREEGFPLTEPRIITTRLDISREMPYVIYDYINWSIYSGRNVMVFVPNLDWAEKVYRYMLNFRQNIKNVSIINNDFDINNYEGIIITDNMQYLDENIRQTDFIVYSAEDKFFEHKKLVYVCSKCERTKEGNMGEVILLAREVSREMETCRDMIRRFNKIAWKRKLLTV